MRYLFLLLPVFGIALCFESEQWEVSLPSDSSKKKPGSTPSDSITLAKHGEYLVHHVAMCVQCHSPRNEHGTLDRQQLLSGAAMPVESPFEKQEWAFRAPSLRGLPSGWSEQNLVKFLQTGEPATTHQIRPPMPPFRLSKQDAMSVAAYLKSLAD